MKADRDVFSRRVEQLRAKLAEKILRGKSHPAGFIPPRYDATFRRGTEYLNGWARTELASMKKTSIPRGCLPCRCNVPGRCDACGKRHNCYRAPWTRWTKALRMGKATKHVKLCGPCFRAIEARKAPPGARARAYRAALTRALHAARKLRVRWTRLHTARLRTLDRDIARYEHRLSNPRGVLARARGIR